jgi:hypothetical protein
MQNAPFDIRMNDGSRHFYAHPTVTSWDDLMDHLEALEGLEITGIVSDDVVETWVDFDYKEKPFSINDQNGDYWFFAEDPHCPENILLDIVTHCGKLPTEEAK